MNLSELAAQYGGKPIEQAKPNLNELAAQFGGKPIEETDKLSTLAAQFGGKPIKETEPESKPSADLAMGSELVKGAKSGVVGIKSMVAGVDLLKDASLVGSALKNLNVYNQIDEGKITSLADAKGLGLPQDQIRMYLAAKTPEAKEQMRQNQQGIIDKRQGFIKEGLSLFKQYQADAEKVKGRTPDFTDIGAAKDFGNWLAFNVGAGAVQLAPIILAALTTGGAGAAAIGVSMGIGETVGNRLEFIQKKVKDLSPEKQADEIEKYIRDTGDSSLLIGALSGSLDLIGPVSSILKARAGKEGFKYLTKKDALKAAAVQAPKDIAKEGVTGGAQETIQIGGEYGLKEQTGDVLTKANRNRLINASTAEAAGSLSGIPVSGGINVAQAQQNQNIEKAKEAAIERDKLATALSDPAAMEKLSKTFQQEVDRLIGTPNPKYNGTKQEGRLYSQQEAYDAAGDLVLKGGILDVDTTTDSGAAKSSVSVSGGQSTTNTGPDATGRTDLGPDTTTAVAIEGGEGAQLNTLTPEVRQTALLKLMSFQDNAGTPPKPREVNALARDLGIKVKKGAKVPDTLQKIQSVLAPPETISGAAADVSTDTNVPATLEQTEVDVTDSNSYFNYLDVLKAKLDAAYDAGDVASQKLEKLNNTPTPSGGRALITYEVELEDAERIRKEKSEEFQNIYAQMEELKVAREKALDAQDLADQEVVDPNLATQKTDQEVVDPNLADQKTGAQEVVDPNLANQEVVVDQEAEAQNAAIENVETDEDLDNVDQLFGQPPKGKGGRKALDRTPEQQQAAAQVRKAQQQAGRDSIDDITRAEKLFDGTENIDPDTFLDKYPTEEAAREAVAAITESRLSALTTAYGYTTGSSKKKKAGVRGAALLAKATPEEQNLAKQRYEDQQNIGKPSRAMLPKGGSTSDKTNLEFEKFNNIKGAVNSILNSKTSTPFEKILAARILPFINGVKFQVVDSHLDLPTTYLQNFMEGAAGLYVPARRIVYVLRKGGLNNTIILHEALHAATVSRIDTYTKLKAEGRMVPEQLSRTIQELEETMVIAKQRYDQLIEERIISGDRTVLTDDMLDIPTDAFDDIKEFVTYGMTFPPMQDFLLLTEGIYAGTSTDIQKQANVVDKLFTKFVQSIRQLFSMDETHQSALQDLIIITNKLLSPAIRSEISTTSTPSAAKAKKPPAAPKPPAKPKTLKVVQTALRKLKFSKMGSEFNKSLGTLYMETRNFADALRLLKSNYNALEVGTIRTVLPVLTTEDITRWVGDRIQPIETINDAVNDMAGMRIKLIRELAEKQEPWTNFNQKYPEGGQALADVINLSTILEVDPTKHSDVTSALKNDVKLQRIEADILNPPVDPKTKKPKNLASLKKERTERIAKIKLIYEGGVLDEASVRPVNGVPAKQKFTFQGWDKLGKYGKGEGHAIFKMAKESYQSIFDMHEKLLIEKIAASQVPGDVNDASTPKGRLIASITKTFQEAKLLEIYFPLMRYGTFWFNYGTGKSGEFHMFESATARNEAMAERVAMLNAAGDNRTLAELQKDGDIDAGDDIRKLREKDLGATDSSKMLKELFSMLDKNKLTDIDAIKDNIYQMYLMTLPEPDIRRKFTHRQGKTGFSNDVLRNFIVTHHTAANQLARLKYADKVRDGIAAAYASLAGNPDKIKLSAFVREISIRALKEITPSTPNDGDIPWDKVANTANQVVFYMLLTAPKSALIQMTQLHVVGLPMLATKYGLNTFTTAARYSMFWNKFGLTKKDKNGDIVTEWGQPSIADSSYIKYHKNPVYKKILTDAWNYANDRDVFQSTYANDMYSMSAVPTSEYYGKIRSVVRWTGNFTAGAFHHAERISREIMFMSSFELDYKANLNKGMSPANAAEKAQKTAYQLTNDALFNYTDYNKPRVMKTVPGRIAFQFLSFGAQMTSLLVRNFYGLLPFLNKSEKKEAASIFFGILLMTGMYSGVTGFPLYSFILGVAEGVREAMRPGMGEDDEDYDLYYDESETGGPLGKRSLDLWFRNSFIPEYFGPNSSLAKMIGLTPEQAKTLSRAAEMGIIPAVTDLGISGSLSLNGLWFKDDKPAKTSREAYNNFLLSFGGPLVSMGGNMYSGFDDINNGRLDKAIEKNVPAWLRGSLTAYRLSKEGAVTVLGAEVKDLEFYTTGKLIAQGLGFGSTEVQQIQYSNFKAKELSMKINSEKANILNRLNNAVMADSDKRVIDILKEVMEFNKKNPVAAFQDETIENSLEARGKMRAGAYQGLALTEKEAEYIYPLVSGTRSADRE